MKKVINFGNPDDFNILLLLLHSNKLTAEEEKEFFKQYEKNYPPQFKKGQIVLLEDALYKKVEVIDYKLILEEDESECYPEVLYYVYKVKDHNICGIGSKIEPKWFDEEWIQDYDKQKYLKQIKLLAKKNSTCIKKLEKINKEIKKMETAKK